MNSANTTTQTAGLLCADSSVVPVSTTTFSFSNTTSTDALSNPTSNLKFPSFRKNNFNNVVNRMSTVAFPGPTTTAFTFSNPFTTNFTFSKPTTTTSPILNPTFTLDSVDTTQSKLKLNCTPNFNYRPCSSASTQTEENLCIDKLLQGLKEMLLSSKYSDFILNVKGKEFRVHKMILAAHSPVFSAMMEHDTKEKATGIANIDDFESITFLNLLNFMYTGKVENLNSDNVLDLYEAADKYEVTELSNLCISYLMNNISIENFCDTLNFSLRHHVRELTDAATQFFLQNSKEIALTAKWAAFLAENPVAGNELFLKVLDVKSSQKSSLLFGIS